MGAANEHSRRVADAEACPVLPGNAIQRAQRADRDAADLAIDIREEDPTVVWGRLARWAEEEPHRLLAATVHLAAMVDIDRPAPTWMRAFGGMPALHPDDRPHLITKRGKLPAASLASSKFGAAVQELATTTDLTDTEIATRLGCSLKTVARYRTAAGVYRRVGPDSERTDSKIRSLIEQGCSNAQIVAETGFAKSTVRYARLRIETELAAERAAPTDGTAA